MANEDFTTYTETDPGSDITITATKVDCTNLNTRSSDVSYVYRDKGADHFSGDFEFLATLYCSLLDTLSYAALVSIQNSVETIYAARTNNHVGLELGFYRDVTNKLLRIVERDDDGTSFADSYIISVDTAYYIKFKRDEAVGDNGTLYCYIYSDSDRTNLLDTLSLALHNKTDYRYIYACNVYNSNTDNLYFSGYVKNLDLQEAAAPRTPSSSNTSKIVELLVN